MAGLKEVRNRIASVGSTRQITQAMKRVSAAKLRRAQDAVTQMRPYAEKLQEILVNVSASLDASENPYAVERETKRVLLVAVTSNRGLCGPFNNNIIKLANQRLKELAGKEAHILCLGKKAADVFVASRPARCTTVGRLAELHRLPGNTSCAPLYYCRTSRAIRAL